MIGDEFIPTRAQGKLLNSDHPRQIMIGSRQSGKTELCIRRRELLKQGLIG